MSALRTTPNLITWWNQFPPALRIIARARLLASLGAGGVIYFTPLIFNQLELTASEIGSGFATAAIAGTIARFVTGYLIDKGIGNSFVIKLAAVFAVIADFCLLNADNYGAYLQGQTLIGAAAGFYWPAVELAVPISCEGFPSSKGFALVRSADAIGTGLGAMLGSIAALFGAIKMVYPLDTICMVFLLALLAKSPLKRRQKESLETRIENKSFPDLSNQSLLSQPKKKWFLLLIPILVLSILGTGMLSLIQSTLPLDLVKGGVSRPPLNEGLSGGFVAIQLLLLVIFQWPIGQWLSTRKPKFGIAISISSFGLGALMLAISSIWIYGIFLVLMSQVLMAFGLAAFLPTTTEAVIQSVPEERRGLAMALFSQTFAISALIAPVWAGSLIDKNGNGMMVWIVISITCLIMLPVTRLVRTSR